MYVKYAYNYQEAHWHNFIESKSYKFDLNKHGNSYLDAYLSQISSKCVHQ